MTTTCLMGDAVPAAFGRPAGAGAGLTASDAVRVKAPAEPAAAAAAAAMVAAAAQAMRMRAWVSMVVSLVACAGLVLVGGCVLAAPVGCWMREVWLLNPPAVV